MRMLTKIFIALTLLACFAAAEPACILLNNQKNLCNAASSLCTWTDYPAKNSCITSCPLSPKIATDCTDIKGCSFVSKGSQSTCTTAAPGGCQLKGSGCTPEDDSCIFIAGGICSVKIQTPEQTDSQQ